MKMIKRESKSKTKELVDILFIDDVSKKTIDADDFKSNKILHLDNAFWIPALGTRKFDGHIYISGATGSGKSFIIRKIIDNDYRKRDCILFSDLNDKDPAYQGMSYTKYDEKGENDSKWLKDNQSNKIMIFDDVQYNENILKYRDYMLEKGRHIGTVVISVNHKLQDYHATKVPLNECRFIIAFPCSNRGSVFRYLKDEIEVNVKMIQDILDVACDEGRHLVVHRFYPNVLATTESLFAL